MTTSIRTCFLADLKMDPRRRLSWPAENEARGHGLDARFPGLPLIVVDPQQHVIWGHCRVEFLLGKGVDQAVVMEVRLEPLAALFMGFNLLQTFFSANLYEKLNFAALALEASDPAEIHLRTGLDIPLNPGLISQLPVLLGNDFSQLMREGRIALPAAREAAAMAPDCRRPLLQLMGQVRFTATQGLRLVSMMREIQARDGSRVEEVLNQAGKAALRSPQRPAEAVLDHLHALRYPRATAAEKAWSEKIARMQLPPKMQVTHAPFFEPPGLEVRLKLPDLGALHRLARFLEQTLPPQDNG